MPEALLEPSIHIPWSQIIGFLLTAAFTLWAWVIRKFGEQHVNSMKELALELKELRKEVNHLTTRVEVMEYINKHRNDKAEQE